LIAAHITRAGVCAELFEDVLLQHQLFTSQHILDEVAEKLAKKLGFPAGAVQSVMKLLIRAATKVEPAFVPQDACRDPEDIPVLGTALAAKAALLITVDKDLLELREIEGIAIIKPGEFWRRVSA
jgi:putative PIN family toxin of toxin-antitoxin system